MKSIAVRSTRPRSAALLALAVSLAASASTALAQGPKYYPGKDPREAPTRGSDYAEIVRCESIEKRIAYCEVAATTRDGVHLVSQLSDASCVEGRSWGYERGRIWVDRGCAGEFGVGGAARYSDGRGGGRGDYGRERDRRERDRYDDDRPYQGRGRELVACESKDNRRRYCAADLRGRRVAVYQNISRIPCEEGRNWGFDDGGVWVDGGCRAEFGITSAGLLQPR